jgi:hypothetical protein
LPVIGLKPNSWMLELLYGKSALPSDEPQLSAVLVCKML